jgi:MoxR-like ATPase
VKVEPELLNYAARLARKTREFPSISIGASPRAALNVLYVAKVFASIEERDYLIPDDLKTAARPTLRHRIILKPEAELEGITANQVISDLVKVVEVPR